VFAGLNIGINLSAKSKTDQSGAKEYDLKTTNAADNDGWGAMCQDADGKDMSCVNGLDYGLLVGYTYPINDDISVSVGYYLGLADISTSVGTPTDAKADASADKHNGILVNVGYALPF